MRRAAAGVLLRQGGVRAGVWIAATLFLSLALPAAAANAMDIGSGDETGNTSPGGSTGSGSGSGSSNPTPKPPVPTNLVITSRTIDYRAGSGGWLGAQSQRTCSPSDSVIGASVKYSIEYDPATDSFIQSSAKILDVSCRYLTKTTSHTSCVVRSEATITMAEPSTEALGSSSDTSAFGRGDHSVSACANSRTYAGMSVDVVKFGRYLADAVTYRVPVTIETSTDGITGATTSEVVSIGSEYQTNLRQARGQLTCSGWANEWSGSPSWTASDCGPSTSTPRYECTAVDPTTPALEINGQPTNTATAFRSGDANAITWSRLQPTGDFIADDGVGTTRFLRSGTPWKPTQLSLSTADALVGLSTSPHNKMSMFTSDDGTAFIAGQIATAYVRGYWASDAGSPTLVAPTWLRSGHMDTTSVRITGVDSDGNWTTESSTVSVATTAVCSGPSASLAFVRARTSA